MRQRALDLFVRWQEASILVVALLLIALVRNTPTPTSC